MFLGIADISFSSRGGQLVVIAASEKIAKALLLKAWNDEMRPYAPSRCVRTFDALHDWNGAAVKWVEPSKAHIWERL